MKNWDVEHFARVDKYTGSVYKLYLQALRDITRLLHNLKIDTSKPFTFNDYPEITHRVNTLIENLSKKVKLQVENGISAEWLQANIKNDHQFDSILKGSRLSEAQRKIYYSRNQSGLKAFLQRKQEGLSLSDRVWLYTNQYKNEIEMAVDVALENKASAQNLSQTVRQYLQNPNMLFRRVRDKNGILHLSKRAASYHPGRGVYRSSYKNAMRLAGTEINMAYRTADHERMKNMPYIKGFKVVISNNHPVRDICDDLKGEYPKEFKFVGWHPNCRCSVRSITVSDSEYDEIERKLLAGEDISKYQSKSTIKNVPAGFTNWITDNRDRVKNWSSVPYFMRDNPDYIKGLKPIIKSVPAVSVLPTTSFVPAKTTKEAEQWAEKNISQKASYAGVPVQFANEWNVSVFDHLQKFPELKNDIEFVGTIQERNKLFVENALNDAISKNSAAWKIALIQSNGDTKAAKKMLTEIYRKKVGRVSSNVMAQAAHYPGIKGVSLNKAFFNDPDKVARLLDFNVRKGFHPQGCNTVKSVIDHEMGHRIDHLLGLKKNADILKLYSDNFVNIKSDLSGYAAYYPHRDQGVSEFIAEGWSEYLNNPKPRKLAVEIGKIIESEYKKQYKKI